MSEREKTVQGLLNAAVEDETLRGWRLMGEAADTIEQLIRERDEARARVKVLEDALEAWHSAIRFDVLMEGPRYMGVDMSRGRDAWEKTRALQEKTNAD
jgi:hypothetical protein